jgi:hypothetical protein
MCADQARARQVLIHPASKDSTNSLTFALSEAQPGDSLILLPGLYRGTFTLKNGVSLLGKSGPDSTVLDADGGRYVLFGRGLDSTTVISGLTLQNGRRDHPNSGGGGIYLHRSSPLIINNVFRDHLGYFGAGVYSNYDSRPVVAFNIFYNNEGYLGGAIAAYQDCSPLYYNNIIYDNRGVSGGAILCMNSTAVIVRNTIVANTAEQGGGAIYCDSSPALIEANVMAYNTQKGAIYSLDDDRPATARRNIVWSNEGGSCGGMGAEFVGSDGNCREKPGFRDLDARQLQRVSAEGEAGCQPFAGARWWDVRVTPEIPDSVLILWREWLQQHAAP